MTFNIGKKAEKEEEQEEEDLLLPPPPRGAPLANQPTAPTLDIC